MFLENFNHGFSTHLFPKLSAGALGFKQHLRQNRNGFFAQRRLVELGQPLNIFQRKVFVVDGDRKFKQIVHAQFHLQPLKEEINQLGTVFSGREGRLESRLHSPAHAGDNLPHCLLSSHHFKKIADRCLLRGIDRRCLFCRRSCRWRRGCRLSRWCLRGSAGRLLRSDRYRRGTREEKKSNEFHGSSLCVPLSISSAACRTALRPPGLYISACESARRWACLKPSSQVARMRARCFCKVSAKASRWSPLRSLRRCRCNSNIHRGRCHGRPSPAPQALALAPLLSRVPTLRGR